MKRVTIALGLLALAGCAAPPFPVQSMVQEWASYMQRDHSLVPGDQLTVSVWQREDLTQEVTVSPEGTINLVKVDGPVRAVGRTVAQLRHDIEERYKQMAAEVSVSLTAPSVQTVFVLGEVRRGGTIPWTSNMSVSKAVAAAGGFDITAKTSDLMVIRAEPKSGAPRSIRVNLNSILYGETSDFPLLPGDVVYAQTSGVADAGNFVELYIRRMLPFAITGVSLGPNQ